MSTPAFWSCRDALTAPLSCETTDRAHPPWNAANALHRCRSTQQLKSVHRHSAQSRQKNDVIRELFSKADLEPIPSLLMRYWTKTATSPSLYLSFPTGRTALSDISCFSSLRLTFGITLYPSRRRPPSHCYCHSPLQCGLLKNSRC